MKNISILASLLILLGIGMTSCKDDTQPRLDAPTEFVLNTPPAAGEMYIFRADEKNNSLNSIEFTVSQPNYGLGCVPDYQVQVAKSEADFNAWDEAVRQDPENDNPAGADGLPLVSTLETVFTTAKMTVTGDVFCGGVNAVYGFDSENLPTGAVPVAVRVHAWLPNAAYSSIFSNVVILKQVSTYIPISDLGVLYLIGQPQGWDINSDVMQAVETEIGSKIYHGVFNVEAGQFQFRFYRALGDWESNSIGAQVEDNPVDISMESGVYEGPCVNGKGSWQDNSWPGGRVEVTINLNDMTIKMNKYEGAKIYVIGQCSGWDINNDQVYITETADGSNVYSGVVSVNAGEFMFRFYTALGDWDANSIGSQADDAPVEISMAGGSFTGACVAGKGSWSDPSWGGGDVRVTLDLNANQVTFDKL